jgi:hypothetical protein
LDVRATHFPEYQDSDKKSQFFQKKVNLLIICTVRVRKIELGFIFSTLLLRALLIVSVTNPNASTVFAIKGGIPNGGNGANAPSPNAVIHVCANTAGNPNQPPFCVTDSDGDGVPDVFDPCPFDPTDNCPRDSDNDGVFDSEDPCPFDPNDICAGPDADGDGIPNETDPCPFDPTNTCTPPDSDNDGIPDITDPCPFDPTNTYRDSENPCPFDPRRSGDFDNDGIPDRSDP